MPNHKSPRQLNLRGAVAEVFDGILRSVFAGYASSTSIARGVLKRPNEEAGGMFGQNLILSTQVDDDAQLVLGGNEDQAL